MKIIKCLFVFCFGLVLVSNAQRVTEMPMILQLPGMDKVQCVKSIVYKKTGDTTCLNFDIYYPPGASKEKLPVLVFMNWAAPAMPEWRGMQDWAKIVALQGVASVVYQNEREQSFANTELLVEHLRSNAKKLGIDENRMGIWGASGSVPETLWPLLNQKQRYYLRCAVIYYGSVSHYNISRQDVALHVVRVGLDLHVINNSLDSLLQAAVNKDMNIEFINYLEGRHSFDLVNNTERSRQIIQSTLDFIRHSLTKNYPSSQRPDITTSTTLFEYARKEKKADKVITAIKQLMSSNKADKNFNPSFYRVYEAGNIEAIGKFFLNNQLPEEALKMFEFMEEIEGSSLPVVYHYLAGTYDVLGNKDKAIEFSKKALEMIDKQWAPGQMKIIIRKEAEERLKKYKQ